MANFGHRGARRRTRVKCAIPIALIALAVSVGLGAAVATRPAISVTQLRGVASPPAPATTPQLVLFRQNRDATVEVLRDGTDAQAGDLVQAAYAAAGNLHGVIVSFDGDGVVTLHHPDEPDETTQLRPGGMTPLDHSFELDDARDFERFVLVSTRDHDIDVSEVLQAATRVAATGTDARDRLLALPPSWMQTSFVLRKPPR